MLPTPIKARSRSLAVLLSLFLLLTSGVLVFARWNHARSLQPDTPSQTQQVSERLEIELITLRPYGFEPNEITRPKGSFVMFVEDRSGKSNSSLELQRVKGELLRAVNTSRMKSDWQDVINLPAGEYVLTDVSQPEAQCRITILP